MGNYNRYQNVRGYKIFLDNRRDQFPFRRGISAVGLCGDIVGEYALLSATTLHNRGSPVLQI